MPDARFTPEERDRLDGQAGAHPPLGPAARAAVLEAEQQERAEEQVERLRGLLGRPPLSLPLLAADRWGRKAVERIADAMEGQL